MTFIHTPTQPIHDPLALCQRVRHFLASGQRVHNFSSWGQRVRHFLVQGLSSPRPKRPRKPPSAGLEPEVVSVPCPRYPMRPEGPMGPKGPHGDASLLSVRPLRAPIGLINYTATSTRSNLTVMRQRGIINKGRRGEGEAIYNIRLAPDTQDLHPKYKTRTQNIRPAS